MTANMSNTLAWMSAVGLPSIFAITIWCFRKVSTFSAQMKILMKAQQAQMRNQLITQYHFYMNQGWISEDDLEDWENQYQSYHALGENGILDKRRETLLSLKNNPN